MKDWNEKKYAVLVDHEHNKQGYLSLVAHTLTYGEALFLVKRLKHEQKTGKTPKDFLIHDIDGAGIYIMEYNRFIYDFDEQ